MLVQEKMLHASTSKAQWALLSLVERAFRNEYCMAEVTRTTLRQLCADGTTGLEELCMELPSSLHQAVSGCSLHFVQVLLQLEC